MKINIKNTQVAKLLIVFFNVVIIIVLSKAMPLDYAWFILFPVYGMGLLYGLFLMKFNWGYRRKVKREAVEELVSKGATFYDNVDEVMDQIERV
jgi:hypothetical protein